MAIFPSFLSYLLFNRAVQLIGGARAGHSTHLMPILGSLMAMLFLGEHLRGYHVAGILLIGSGILISQRNNRPGGPSGAPGPRSISPAIPE